MIGRRLAAVAAHEGADRHARRHFDLVGGDETEAGLVPSFGGAEILDFQHCVAEPDDMGRPGGKPRGLAQPRLGARIIVRRLDGQRQRLRFGLTGNNFDAIAVGIAQPHDKAAAGRRRFFERHAFARRQRFEIAHALRSKTQRQKTRFAKRRRMHEGLGSGAARIQHTV